MAIAASSASLSLNGGIRSKKVISANGGVKPKGLGMNLPQLAIIHQTKPLKNRAIFTVNARREGSGGEGEFFAGFFLGGAIFGALAYYYAPQIRKVVLNENEHGFRRPKMDDLYSPTGIYSDVYVYPDKDGGLEKTRKSLNSKIKQLNNAIDNVSSKLKEKVSSTFPAQKPINYDDPNNPPPNIPKSQSFLDPDSDMKYGV